MTTNERLESFWSVPLAGLSECLNTDLHGLTTAEAERRARVYAHYRSDAHLETILWIYGGIDGAVTTLAVVTRPI